MTRLCLLKAGQSTFELDGRIEAVSGAPLTEEGMEQTLAAAEQLNSQKIAAVYAAPGEGESQTAKLVAKVLGVKVRTYGDLHELDYGLWQGLTVEEIKRRQPKVCRQWFEAPSTVCPPGGETLAEADSRLRGAVAGILKKHSARQAPLLVLRPVALGLLRCALERTAQDSIWRQMDPAFTWSSYETNGEDL